MNIGKALYDYVLEIKNQYLRNVFGTHTTHARVQGLNLKTKKEIHIASLFKDARPNSCA